MYTLLTVFAIALLSFVGALVFRNMHHAESRYPYAVPVAIGMFLGIVFFELIPETLEVGGEFGSFAIVGGFLAFYFLAHALKTYHHHHSDEDDCDSCERSKASASLLLIGDAIHNFADGIVVATAFIVNPAVGFATAIAIAFHEIPQEIAEFGVLLSAGYSKKRAALLNFISALSIVFGALFTMFLAEQFGSFLWILTGIAAGNLLYISASDLLPEMHGDHTPTRHFLLSFFALIFGIVVIVGMVTLSHELFGAH